MEKALQNKNILFLCPSFFNYEKKLTLAMENLGANVDFYDERPSNTFFSKSFLRINRNLVKRQIKKYYDEILSKIEGKKYDFILISQAEATPLYFIEQIKNKQATARMVLLLWDSIANKINTVEKIPFFDEVFSFDKKDCDSYALTFRPLFFDYGYEKIATEKVEMKFDLFFVGTVHSDRYSLLKKVKEQFENNSLNVFYYLYFPSKIIYYFKKLTTRELTGSKIDEFSFVGLPSENLVATLKSSKTVIDIQHPLQTGLTMRTIEMLGANRKMITTNKDVMNYDFYNSANICVINRENPIIPIEFMESSYIPVKDEIKQRYSINYFILELLNLTNDSHNYYI